MALAYQPVTQAEVDAERSIHETLMAKFFNNQEAAITGSIDSYFTELSTSTAAPGWGRIYTHERLYVPPQAGTTLGDVVLVFRPELRVGAGVTADYRCRLGTGAYQTVFGVTATTYGFVTFTIPATEIRAAADSELDLELDAQIVAGAGPAFAQHVSNTTRFERLP